MNTRTIIIFTLIFLLSIPVISQTKNKPEEPLTFEQLVWQIRQGNARALKNIIYENLLQLSDFIRIKAQKSRKSFLKYLEGDRYREGVVRAAVKGLFNRDPRVRLYCAHLLLKIAPRRKWLEKDINRVIERETVDKFYFFTDLYGRVQYRNIREMIHKLLDIGYTLILLSPKPNLITYSKCLDFEWSGVYGAVSYDLYINDILYHRGEETLAPLVNLSITDKSAYGSYRWLVVAKDFNDRIITQNTGHFVIKQLEPIELSVSGKNPPQFKWTKIYGADYYVLYIATKNNQGKIFRKIIYKGDKNYFTLKQRLPQGNYICYLVVGNESQRVVSNKVAIRIEASRIRILKQERREKPKTDDFVDDDLDFDIDDFKDLEEDTIDE